MHPDWSFVNYSTRRFSLVELTCISKLYFVLFMHKKSNIRWFISFNLTERKGTSIQWSIRFWCYNFGEVGQLSIGGEETVIRIARQKHSEGGRRVMYVRANAYIYIPFFETQFVNEDAWFCSTDRIPFRCTRDRAKHSPSRHARTIIELKVHELELRPPSSSLCV